MPPISRVATLRIDDVTTHGTTGFRQWVATAAVQDTPAGQSVVITTVHTVSGAPPTSANPVSLNLYTDAGVLIRTFALSITAAPVTDTSTFFFTSDGTSTGSPRADVVEIAIRATSTGAGSYDVETDGSPNSPPATFDSHLNRGWIRGTTTATVAVSNVSLGGAKPSLFAYPDTIFHRTTLGAASYVARTQTATVTGASPAQAVATNSTVGPVFDATITAAVDNRFPVSSSAQTASVTVPNATLTGLPYTVLTTLTTDSLTIDPRLTVTHLMQFNSGAFATPPASADKTERETTDLAFLSARFTNARAEGRNGMLSEMKLWDTGQLISSEASPVEQVTEATTTQGGQAGWIANAGTLPVVWDNQLPAGSWTTKVAAGVSNALGLEVGNIRTVNLKGTGYALDPIALALHGVLSHR